MILIIQVNQILSYVRKFVQKFLVTEKKLKTQKDGSACLYSGTGIFSSRKKIFLILIMDVFKRLFSNNFYEEKRIL